MAKIVQTAGRDNLGDFAPQFAHFNDEVLFGEEWNNEDITAKTRSIITISVFMGRGLVDPSLKAHLQIGRKNGITKKEITALITNMQKLFSSLSGNRMMHMPSISTGTATWPL